MDQPEVNSEAHGGALKALLKDPAAACPSCGHGLGGLDVSVCPECGQRLRVELRAGPERAVVPARLVLWATVIRDLVVLGNWIFSFGGRGFVEYVRSAWRFSSLSLLFYAWLPVSLSVGIASLALLRRRRFVGLSAREHRRIVVVCGVLLLTPVGILLAVVASSLLR